MEMWNVGLQDYDDNIRSAQKEEWVVMRLMKAQKAMSWNLRKQQYQPLPTHESDDKIQ